jgi:plastocyanin
MVLLIAMVTMLGLPAIALAQQPISVPCTPNQVCFGMPHTGSPFPPNPPHDSSANAKDNIVPRTVVIPLNGSVTFNVQGRHQVAIYDVGTQPEDITVPPGTGFAFINDPDDRVALGPAQNAPPGPVINQGLWTTPAGTFDQAGTYLVICNVRPHFQDGMYSRVRVQ